MSEVQVIRQGPVEVTVTAAGEVEVLSYREGEAAALAEKWAEGTAPGGPATKSSREHAQDSEASAAVSVTASTAALDARDIVEAMRNFYETRSTGAAATASGALFTSAEEGSLAWYRSAGAGSYVRIDFAATKTVTDALAGRALRTERRRSLAALLRGRKFRRMLGAKNGYTSATSSAACTIASVADYPFDPPFGLAPNILTQKPAERRRVTSIAAPGTAAPNYLTVTCERPHGLAAGDRIRFYGSTFPGPNSINTDLNEGLWGTDGGQGAKVPYPSVTAADVIAGNVAKGIHVHDVTDAFTFRVKVAASLGWSDNTSYMWWEPLPRFWPATDPSFDWVVPGRREAIPRNDQGSSKPSFGTANTGDMGGSGATPTKDAQVKIAAVEFQLHEDVLVICSASAKLRVFADGVPVHNGVLNVSTPDSPGYRTTITFKDSRTRLIRVETTNTPANAFVASSIYGFWTRGHKAISLAQPVGDRRPLMLLCADSFGEGEGIPNWQMSFGSMMAERLGWDVIHGALGSTGLTTGGAHGVNMNYSDRMKIMKAGGIEPDVICILNSLNDFGNVTEAAATDFIDRIRSMWPNIEIIVLGSSYPNENIPTGRLDSDRAWVAACDSRGVPFIDGGIGTNGLPAWVNAGNKATYYHGTAASGATMAGGGVVTDVAVVNGGAGYDPANGAPAVTFSGGGGTGAAAQAVLNYKVTDLQIVNGGKGYTTAALTIGHGIFATAIESGGEITGVIVNNPGGVMWRVAPPITITGGGGTGATAEAVLEGGVLVAIRMTATGSGYTSTPTVNVGICSTNATATATIVNGVITGATITNAGDLYIENPVCTVVGDGYGAEIVPFISGTVTGFTGLVGGSGYTSAPVVTIAHPNGDDVTHPKPNGHRLLAHRYVAGIERLMAA